MLNIPGGGRDTCPQRLRGAQMAWLELMQRAHKVPHLLGMAAFVLTMALNVPSYSGICITAIPCLLSSTEIPEDFASGCPYLCAGSQARLPVLQRWSTYVISKVVLSHRCEREHSGSVGNPLPSRECASLTYWPETERHWEKS